MTVAHDLWNDFIKLNSVEIVLGDLHMHTISTILTHALLLYYILVS